MKNRQKGFTLIELLIVVVILAVLASLVLPRFLQQPARAAIAEATVQLGAIRRAQMVRADMIGAAPNTFIAGADTAAGAPNVVWTSLGLGDSGLGARYDYLCTAGVDATVGAVDPVANAAGTCTATQVGTAANMITISNSIGTFGCAGAYTRTQPVGTANRTGCMIT